MTQAMQFTTDVASGETVLQALQRETQLSEQTLQDAAHKGAVWVNLQRGRGRTRPRRQRTVQCDIAEGSTVMLNYNPAILAQVPLKMHCVSAHANYGIWFKPAGMLCQGSKWSDHTTATQTAQGIIDRQCHLVHRLDRSACGLLLIAYTRNALRAFTAMFEHRAMHKRYQASIEGTLTDALPLTIDTPIDGKSATTIIHEAKRMNSSDLSILSLSIETGRKHQIRKHLSQLGHPIVGDRLYGVDNSHLNADNLLSDTKRSVVHVSTEDALEQHVATEKLSKEYPATSNLSSGKVPADELQLVACGLRFVCPFAKTEVNVNIDADAALAGALTA